MLLSEIFYLIKSVSVKTNTNPVKKLSLGRKLIAYSLCIQMCGITHCARCERTYPPSRFISCRFISWANKSTFMPKQYVRQTLWNGKHDHLITSKQYFTLKSENEKGEEKEIISESLFNSTIIPKHFCQWKKNSFLNSFLE